MLIHPDKEKKLFHLQSGNTSYIMTVNPQGYLAHGYWGRKLPVADYGYTGATSGHGSFEACRGEPDPTWISENCMRLEYPVTGRADVKKTALEIINKDGTSYLDLRYKDFRLHQGKPRLDGLPATYETEVGQAETIEILLEDPNTGVEVGVFYSVWQHLDAICRWAIIRNTGSSPIFLERAMSGCVDFPDCNYIMTTNYGTWANERQIQKHKLFNGTQGIYSRRGSSSHMHNPFVILQRPDSGEYTGDVSGAVLAYSGNHEVLVDVDSYDMTRMLLGINPEGFRWKLEPGEHFTTPELCMVYSHQGLNGMSGTFHKLFRDHMARGKYKNQRRPVLLNTWEACYFNINEEIIENIAKESAALGIELIVVDEGWYGNRKDETSGMGDWVPNPEKFPHGLEELSRKIHAAGCKMGIWFEPEMVNPDSNLYRSHPDWVLGPVRRPLSIGRNQLILDLCRKEVQDYLYNSLASVIRQGQVSYVKWDFNRNFAEIGSPVLPPDRQGEVCHRYVLGLYALMERLVQEFPDVLFESCSGGGGRFDAGMLYYMPQTWTSDDTDAIMRLSIQYGTSLVYPLSCMSAHISVCPNHQTKRTVAYKTRQDVAYTGSFGFELNPLALSLEERTQLAATAEDYKSYGDLFVNGNYYRHANIYDDGYAAWSFVSQDRRVVLLTYATIDVNMECIQKRFRLIGLDEDGVYVDIVRGTEYTGAALMYDGLLLNDFPGDRETVTWRLERKGSVGT